MSERKKPYYVTTNADSTLAVAPAGPPPPTSVREQRWHEEPITTWTSGGEGHNLTVDAGPLPTAAADVTPDPFLTQWNADVKACEACKVAQKESDDEYMDDHVAWCDEHRAQFNAWGTRAAAANADEEWMQYTSVPLVPLPMDDTPDAAAMDVREHLAALAHEQWVGWMRYFLGKCDDAPDGSVVVPADYESALLHLMDKAYADLSEEQKDNDRKEADRVLAIVGDSRAAAADVTVYVAGIGNVRMPPDDALRMLFEEVLTSQKHWHRLTSNAASRQQNDIRCDEWRARLAALLGDGGGE